MKRSLADRLRPWWSLQVPDGIADEASLRRARAFRWWAVGFAVAFVAVYVLFVWTYPGQRWDDAAWYGFKVQDGDFLLAAKNQLRAITIPSLIGVSALLCLVAWLRWGLRTAMAVALFLIVTLGVAELLKHVILPRPDLYDFELMDKGHNTLPSGHTTIGAIVAVGFILVLPRQIRGITTVVAAFYAASVGGSTLAAGWHRPSDAIAAFLLVGFATVVVVGLMLHRGTARLLAPTSMGPLRGWSLVVWVVPALTLVTAWSSWTATAQEWERVSGSEPLIGWTVPQRDLAFTAGLLADYAAAGLVFTLIYLLLRRVEFGVSREDWSRWRRRRDAEAAFSQLPVAAVGEPVGPSGDGPVSLPARRLPDVTLLPDITSDESGSRESFSDDHYRHERPPHHGD